MRADAERNRRLIIETARRAFARRGLGVRLDEIAREAGLGTGTVYRRFENKDALIQAVFEETLDQFVALADQVLTEDTDGGGLRRFLEQAGELMASDRGFQQLLTGSASRAAEISTLGRARIEPRIIQLLDNARAAGRLRTDVTHDDFPIIQVVLSAIIEATGQVRPDLWKRYYTLVLDGLEPGPGNRALTGPSPSGDDAQTVIERWRPQPREPGARG